MKQTFYRKCMTGLTLGIFMLTGSSIATAEASCLHGKPALQKAQQTFYLINTNYTIALARPIKKDTLQLAQPVDIKTNAAAAKQVAAKKQQIVVKKTAVKKTIATAKPIAKKAPAELLAKKSVAKPTAKKAVVDEVHVLKISEGKTIKYSRLIPVKASAYTAAAEENGMWGAFDYLGDPLKLGTIAVDPDVIPMGTTVYITGYSFDGLPAKGMVAKATDQGGSIKGKRVDIFVPTSKADATKFGLQDVKVYVIK